MSSFEVLVYRLKIEPHPNADAIELAIVGDYRSVVRKGDFKTGDLGVYIPEASIVPNWIIKKMGLEDRLSGPNKNRVKAIKLRGIVSQGLIYPVITDGHDPDVHYDGHIVLQNDEPFNVDEGTELVDILGITKYEPPIPLHMAGEVWNAFGYTIKYDIDNIKKYPDIVQSGEHVVFTEKLHGTWACFGYHPTVGKVVTSKGLSAQGLALKFNDANKDNLYIKTLNETCNDDGKDIIDRINDAPSTMRQEDLIAGDNIINYQAFYILGEIFGPVQDLKYGFSKPQFRVFDIYFGQPGRGWYLNDEEKDEFCIRWNLQRVPVLYRGPYSKDVVREHTSGKETVSGKSTNIREGIVITPAVERRSEEIGRIILKSVSDAYLLRGGDSTEFN